jgi:hypothetical protein
MEDNGEERQAARQVEHAQLMATALEGYDSELLQLDDICGVEVVHRMGGIRSDRLLVLDLGAPENPRVALTAHWMEGFYAAIQYMRLRARQ